jgi:hypothetical protein
VGCFKPKRGSFGGGLAKVAREPVEYVILKMTDNTNFRNKKLKDSINYDMWCKGVISGN